jgi:hypothetical protein
VCSDPATPAKVPAAATLDTTAAALAANLQVANAALIQIGARRSATSRTTKAARRNSCAWSSSKSSARPLRDYPWPFATRYVTPALVGGTSQVPVNADWQYSYRLPADLCSRAGS